MRIGEGINERFDDGIIKGEIDAITLEKTQKICEQMRTCIYKVYGERKNGTGFFCKIKYNNEIIPILMTNYHIINDEYIKKYKKKKIIN